MGKCAMIIALVAGLSNSAFARDDGRYDNDPLKYWFDNLTSSNGRCCSFADGFSVDEVEWDTDDGHYRVWLHGQWVNVPSSSVVTEPNRYGPARVALHGHGWQRLHSMFPARSRCINPPANKGREIELSCLTRLRYVDHSARLSYAVINGDLQSRKTGFDFQSGRPRSFGRLE